MLKVSRIVSLTLLLVLMALPLTAGAQAAEPIAIGDSVEGTLTEANSQALYEFEATAGQTISITLSSSDFDAYLLLQVGDENVIASDDDSAGSLNSRIGAFTIPEDGTYTIVATSYSAYYNSGATPGDFTLSLAEFETRSIEYTQTVDAELTDEELVAYYTFSGQEGDTVIIRLNSSDFDSYLRLSDAGGELMSNDDGGGNLNSLIGPYVLPATGTYTIAASSLSESATGSYTLSLERVELNIINFGDEVEGELGKNAPAIYFSFEGTSGDVVSIEVDSDADTNLTLNDPYNYQVAFDEDGGSGANPEISEVSLNSTGIYTIVVQSPFGDTGAQVDRFVEVAVVGRAVTDEAEDDAILIHVLDLERDACRQRQMPADNRIAAPEVVIARREVHRAAFAAADAGALAHHLGHQGFGVDAARQRNAVIAISGDDVILLAQCGQRTNADRLMAAVEVQVNARDLLLFVKLVAHHLELPDEYHLIVPIEQCFLVWRRHSNSSRQPV